MISVEGGPALRAVVDLIDHAAQDDPGPILPWSVLDDLARLIPAEEVTIADLDLVNESRVIQYGFLGLTEKAMDGPADDDPADTRFSGVTSVRGGRADCRPVRARSAAGPTATRGVSCAGNL